MNSVNQFLEKYVSKISLPSIGIIDIIEILITVLAYLPFFKILDKQAYLEENPSTEN